MQFQNFSNRSHGLLRRIILQGSVKIQISEKVFLRKGVTLQVLVKRVDNAGFGRKSFSEFYL